MMQVSKKIPFDNPDVLLGVRVMYILSNVIILGIYLYVQAQINKKKGTLALQLLLSFSFVFGCRPLSLFFSSKSYLLSALLTRQNDKI